MDKTTRRQHKAKRRQHWPAAPAPARARPRRYFVGHLILADDLKYLEWPHPAPMLRDEP